LEGSKNPGATNVLRLAGKQYAIIVLVFDMLKGLFPVLLAKMLMADPITIGFTCFAAVLGHMYPVFFDFKGGKGVATALGALLGFHFHLGVAVIATWLLIANFFRYSSLASIVSLLLAPFYSLGIVHNLAAFPPLMCIAIFILYKHRDNITRLIDGTEPRINLTPVRSLPPIKKVRRAKLEATTKKTTAKKTAATVKKTTVAKRTVGAKAASKKKAPVKKATAKKTVKKKA
jgi:glycerol-3-phosphate acyltransferase PlsY